MPPVTANWNSIRKWIEANTEYDAKFDKGAKASELRAFEKSIGRKLPKEFTDSLKKYTRAKGVIPAPNREWSDMAYSIMSIDEIHNRWRMIQRNLSSIGN